MTTTVDNRAVHMEFDNRRFESGVQDSLKSIDSLKKSLNFEGASKGLEGINVASRGVNFGPIASGLDDLKNRFSLMGIVGITIIQDITRKLMGMAEQIARTFVVDPIKAGLNEYELKLNSIQTILANTQKEGTNLEIVTAALNKLNEYSDKTIYSFQEMTRNIGTFTAAGVSLETSTAAIKGIANLAAISGSNSQQASTAMYQLSQALSTGTLKLMDWNSVVNAGMGGQVFQDALKETARVHGVAVDQIIEEEGSFRDSLMRGWATSEILTETLAKFTGDLTESQLKTMGYNEEQIAGILKMGQTANDAATKVKTLTQLNDTLKEAAQSGWAQTWELIIGDFEEAKAFFTDMSNLFGGLISASADSRNALIKSWKDLGGRTSILNAVRNSIDGILSVLKPIGEAFREIIPPITGQQLADFSRTIENITQKFKIGADAANTLKRIFRGVFAVIDIGKMFVVSLAQEFGKLIGSYSSVGASLGDLLASLGDWLVGLRDSIKSSNTFSVFLGKVAKAIKVVIDFIGGFVAGVVSLFKTLSEGDPSHFTTFLDTLSEKVKSLGKVGDFLSALLDKVSEFASRLAPRFDSAGKSVGDSINGFLEKMTAGLRNLDVNKVLDLLNKGLLGTLLLSLKSFVDQSKSVIGGGLFAGILLSIKSFIDKGANVFEGVKDILDGVRGSLDAYQKQLKANTLLKIAGAVALLAAAILVISFIPADRLLNATTAIATMFVALMASLEAFEKNPIGGKKLAIMTLSIIGISGALLVLAGAITVLAKLDLGKAIQGVLAIGAVLAMLVAFTKYIQTDKGMLSAVVGLDMLSVALFILSSALGSLGKLETDQLVKGVVGLAAALGIITIAMNTMPVDLAAKSLGLIVLSGALLILSRVIKEMGGLSWEEVGVGLTVLAGSMTILAVALNAMASTLPGSAALLVASAAIFVLATSLKLLSTMSWEGLAVGLVAIAGTFAILGIAGAVLAPVVPVILLLAVAMGLIGVAALAFGAGVLAIAVAIGTLAAAIFTLSTLGAAGIAAVTLVITGLAALIPVIAVQLVKGITAFIIELSNSAKRIGEAVIKIALQVIQNFLTIIPDLVDAIFTFVTSFLSKLAEALPEIVQAGWDILKSLLKGIDDNIEDVVNTGSSIIRQFLRVWGEALPGIIKAGWDFMISFIDGLAAAAEENIPRLMESLQRLGMAIVRGVIDGIFAARGELISAIRELGSSILSEFASILGIHSPSEEFIEISRFITEGLILGIDRYATNVYSSTKDLAQNIVSGFSSVASEITDSINSSMDFSPTIRPVVDLTDVEAGSSRVNTLLRDKTLNISATARRARSIDTSTRPPDINVPQNGTNNPEERGIQFIQNNYSPKELSRIELYRQTRNQLLQAKGLAGVS